MRALAWTYLLARCASGLAPWSLAIEAFPRVTPARRAALLEYVNDDSPPELRALLEEPVFEGVSLAFLVRMSHADALVEAARRIERGEQLRAGDRAAYALRCDAWLGAHPDSPLRAMVERARDEVLR